MCVRTTWVHIQNYPWYDVCTLILVNICMQTGCKCEHSQGHKQVWECTAQVDIPTYPWYDSWYMYTCEYVYVYNDVLGVSTRKGANICQLAQHGFIYKSICDGIYVYLWAHVCMQRGSKCEHSQGHRQMWVRTSGVQMEKFLWYDIIRYDTNHLYTHTETSS